MTIIIPTVMDGITDALVEAGYYRARITTLSEFDKIIGGIAWAMQVFSYDIDLDIFYTDTLDLGQKIALTERLVMVLLVMNCPHPIEPHQIVGLDYTNLLPVIKWLIKRSAEVRREHEAFNRLLALRHFFRVTNSKPVRSTGNYHLVPLDHLRIISESKRDRLAAHAADESVYYDRQIPTNLSQPVQATSLLIDKLSEDFKHNKQMSFVKLPTIFRAANRAQEGQAKVQPDDSETSEADESSEDEAKSELANTDKIFKAESKVSGCFVADEVKTIAEELTPSSRPPKSKATSEDEATKKVHEELNIELLATNQKILNLLRKLDCMPSHLEIYQYQKRYIELHQQLISKNKDLKKLYALFNSLDSTKHYLTKEINLLDSIMSNLDLTNNSPGNRLEFSRQFQEIIVKIQSVRDDVVSRLEVVRSRCAALNAEYAALTSN